MTDHDQAPPFKIRGLPKDITEFRATTAVDPWVWGERQYNEKHRPIEENSRLKVALYEIAKGRHVNAKGEIESRPSHEASVALRALELEDPAVAER